MVRAADSTKKMSHRRPRGQRGDRRAAAPVLFLIGEALSAAATLLRPGGATPSLAETRQYEPIAVVGRGGRRGLTLYGSGEGRRHR